MAVGFYVASQRNEAWGPQYAGGFHDEAVQERLLPLFCAGGGCVDPYDGGEFNGEALQELRSGLTDALTRIAEEPEDFGLSQSELAQYYARARFYGIIALNPKERAIADLRRAIALIDTAIEKRVSLFFVGD